MFKCTECGCEYEIKPDFCDCGNDEFCQIKETHEEKKSNGINVQHAKSVQSNEQNIIPKAQKKQTSDILSIVIFITCVILSFLVIFFAWNPKENTQDTKTQAKTNINTASIPSIDSFWNNELPSGGGKFKGGKFKGDKSGDKSDVVTKNALENRFKNEQVESQKVAKTVQIKKVTPQTNTQKLNSSKTKQQTEKKTTQKIVQKNTQTNSKKTTSTAETKTANQTTNKKTESVKVTTVPLTKNPQISTVEQTKNSLITKQELANYKISLRNTIGRKIDFTKVIGDGNCIVSFKINESGKLINRTFTKQSTNITLNDAVYSAVMSTPTYNPPPSGYQNETLNLNIKFYNGNFEITLN